jgi:hypothetical protein
VRIMPTRRLPLVSDPARVLEPHSFLETTPCDLTSWGSWSR